MRKLQCPIDTEGQPGSSHICPKPAHRQAAFDDGVVWQEQNFTQNSLSLYADHLRNGIIHAILQRYVEVQESCVALAKHKKKKLF